MVNQENEERLKRKRREGSKPKEWGEARLEDEREKGIGKGIKWKGRRRKELGREKK